MIKGYVVNNLGRGKHIFKQPVAPGMKIPLEELYELYSRNYDGEFDTGFLEWLERKKIPKGSGFDIVLEDILPEDISPDKKQLDSSEKIKPAVSVEVHKTKPREEKLPPPRKMTSRQISELKIKDKPKIVLQNISSVHKLRRALNLCKGRPGKETLTRLIRERMTELS